MSPIGLLLWGALDQTALAVTLTVDTTADTVNAADGVTSLREALQAAASGDTIAFGFAAQQTIVLAGTLPAVPSGVTVDGQQLVVVDAGSQTTGPGLSVGADAVVTGLSIANAPGPCVLVTGDGARVGDVGTTERNWLWACGDDGILVDVGVSAVTIENNVVGADASGTLSGACAAPSGGCAGIHHASAEVGNQLVGNYVVATQGDPALSQGIGIAVVKGSSVQVTANWLGITPGASTTGAGNLGHGIVAAATSGNLVQDLVIDGNVVLGSGRSGIFLGPRSDGTTVSHNQIGRSGATVVGNAVDGVAVFASDDHTLTDNTVVASGQTGIHLWGSVDGDWQSGTTISQNHVGGYSWLGVWSAAGNGEQGIRSEGEGGGHTIEGNAVCANTLSGMVLEDPGTVVQGNRVGTVLFATTVYPNGAHGIVASGDSIRIGGAATWGQLPVLGEGNLVVGNVDHGIVIGSGAAGVEVLGNVIGVQDLSPSGAFGNGGSGIYVESGSDLLIGSENAGNVIAGNERGIEVDGTLGVDGLEIGHNQIGLEADSVLWGNQAEGIEIRDAVTDARLHRNLVVGNGAVGVLLDAVTSVELRENRLDRNAACGISFVNGANLTGGLALLAPELTIGHKVTPAGFVSGLTGTFIAPAADYAVMRIEVFYDDDGTEQSLFLGNADIDPLVGRWTLEETQGIPTPDPRDGRVSAIMTVGVSGGGTFTDVRSSDAGTYCGDGCAAVGAGACPMGDPCQTYDCDATDTCIFLANTTADCLDGDPCTVNDVCAAGSCTPGPVITNCTLCIDVFASGKLQTRCDDGSVHARHL
jgi:hypothetical protein